MKKKEPIDIELTKQNADPEIIKNAINFRLSDVQEEEEDIAKANFIENYKIKIIRKIFQKTG